MRIRHTILAMIVGVTLCAATGDATENRLRIDVTPRVSSAPATVRVRAIVAPSAENRALQVAADSGDFYRSSYVPLAGADAASVTETTLKNLPGGEYEVSVTLIDAQGRQTIERRMIVVTSSVRD